MTEVRVAQCVMLLTVTEASFLLPEKMQQPQTGALGRLCAVCGP